LVTGSGKEQSREVAEDASDIAGFNLEIPLGAQKVPNAKVDQFASPSCERNGLSIE